MTIKLETKRLERNLARLSRTEAPRAMARALTKIALDVRAAEVAHVTANFPKASTGGRRYIAGFRAIPAKAADSPDLFSAVLPRGGALLGPPSDSEKILIQHREGGQITPRGPVERLVSTAQLAIPTFIQRGRSGKVRKRQTPGNLLASGRGFFGKLSTGGEGIFVKVGRGKNPRIRLGFTLRRAAPLEPRIEFYRIARAVAKRGWLTKARKEMARIRLA